MRYIVNRPTTYPRKQWDMNDALSLPWVLYEGKSVIFYPESVPWRNRNTNHNHPYKSTTDTPQHAPCLFSYFPLPITRLLLICFVHVMHTNSLKKSMLLGLIPSKLTQKWTPNSWKKLCLIGKHGEHLPIKSSRVRHSWTVKTTTNYLKTIM